ncbi:MAG: hypothetical protein J5855_10080 [Mailhella sp.]|nr:hypothetical protein [Mailhella sp.]
MNKYAGMILKAELIALAPIMFFLLDGSVKLYILAAITVFYVGRLSAAMKPGQPDAENKRNRRQNDYMPNRRKIAYPSAVLG